MQFNVATLLFASFALAQPRPDPQSRCLLGASGKPDSFIILYKNNVTPRQNATLVNEIKCHSGRVTHHYSMLGFKGLAATIPQDLAGKLRVESPFRNFIDNVERDGEVSTQSKRTV